MDRETLRAQIEAADDLPLQPVEIPEWDIEAYIRPLDGESRYRIGQLSAGVDVAKENIYITEAYVCEGLVTENGERIFEIADRAILGTKSPAVLERLYNLIVEASGMLAEDEAEAEKK